MGFEDEGGTIFWAALAPRDDRVRSWSPASIEMKAGPQHIDLLPQDQNLMSVTVMPGHVSVYLLARLLEDFAISKLASVPV